MTRRTTGAVHAQSPTDRLAQWWSGWRVAVITAARDARRYRGTTVLIMVMIGLPVLLITGFGTLLSTTNISPAERLHWELGTASAKVIASVQGGPVVQDPAGSSWGGAPCRTTDCNPAKPRTWTSTDIAQATGGHAYRIAHGRIAVAQGGHPLVVSTLALDAGGYAATGIATLQSGHWPATPDEILVSPRLAARGITSSGTISATIDGRVTTLDVVGVGTATDDQGQPLGVLGLTGAFGDSPSPDNPSFLITRATPFGWHDIEQLNTHGLVVVAPEFVLQPDRAILTGPYAAQQAHPVTPIDAALVMLMIFGVLLETTLLAGPAFAVSTARRRRTLALVASNGATRQQLRRYVLAQGLVLGAAAAAIGAALGVALPAIGFPIADRILGSQVPRGPFQPNWPVLAGVALTAAIAALIAASIPARGGGRLDIAQTLAGRVSLRRQRGLGRLAIPIVAALVTTGALAGCAIIALAPDPQRLLMTAAVLSIVAALGSLCLVGSLIDFVGRLGRGPIGMRIALRDARRNRGRTIPAVAAIAATVTVVTMLTVANTSDMAQYVRDYTPQARYGDGWVHVGAHGSSASIAEIRRQHPDWQIAPVSLLGKPVEHSDRVGSTAALVPNGCDPARVLDNRGTNACSAGFGSVIAPVGAAAVDPPADVAAAIANGTAVVVSDPLLVRDGRVVVATAVDNLVHTITVPAMVVSEATMRQAFPTMGNAVWIPPGLAEHDHLPRQQLKVFVHDPDGPISVAEQQAINERVTGAHLAVERGPIVGTTRMLLVGMLAVGGFLVLVAALIATALGRAESRADLATYAAVGASGGTLRRLAAAQALVVCGIGVAQGVATGLLPGIALAAALTSGSVGEQHPLPPIIQVPWSRLLGGLAGAAVLAGLLAAMSVRRLPLVRRVE